MRTVVTDGGAGKHSNRQGQNVARTLAQGGNSQCDHAKSIVQILAEPSCRNFRNQVMVRRGDDSSVDCYRVFTPHPFERLFLDEVQKFGLKRCCQICNFIEEDGSAVRGFEESGLILDCAVESTARMAEQLALEKMFRMSGTVDGHERTFGAKTPSMDLMRKNVLAGTALAGEKNRCVAGGGALHLLQQSSHHGIRSEEHTSELQSLRHLVC